jgi:hypothetical protein
MYFLGNFVVMTGWRPLETFEILDSPTSVILSHASHDSRPLLVRISSFLLHLFHGKLRLDLYKKLIFLLYIERIPLMPTVNIQRAPYYGLSK